MALRVNQSGTWRNITTQCVNQSSTWRGVVDGCANQSGTWRCFGMSAPTMSAFSASPASIVQGAGTCSVLTWSTTKATSTSSNFGATATSGTCNVTPGSTTTYSISAVNAFATSAASTATVTVTAPALGSSFGGGRLICRSGGVNWIVAPSSSQQYTSWHNRGSAISSAQSVSGCTGWFIPNIGQLQNPGFNCRGYWDSYSTNPCNRYWSNTDSVGGAHPIFAGIVACQVRFTHGQSTYIFKTQLYYVRAFRCVTY